MSKKVVIAGGSGFIGSALCKLFHDKGYEVVVLSRSGKAPAYAKAARWDGRSVGEWKSELDGCDVVVNLAGDNIAQHWTKESKTRILESRVESSRAIADAIHGVQSKPKVWINGSAIGYYGNRGDEELTEQSAPGKKGDFLVDTCVAWEATATQPDTEGTRKAILRTGLVLGRGGGTFEPLYNLTKWFLGGHAGSGDQIMSWIHIEDLCRMILAVAEGEITSPIVNGVAPAPVSNEFFMATMRAVLHRPGALPIPAFFLKLVSQLGGPEASLLLEGQRVLPKAAMDAGFSFRYPSLKEAIEDLVKR